MQKDKEQLQRMFATIEGWKSSGLSQIAYCKQMGITYHSFHYWYKKYREQHFAHSPADQPFIALEVKPATATATTGVYAELIMPNGKRLLLHQSMDLSTLKALLQ